VEPAMSASAFENRLTKNVRHFTKWARRQGLEAYRVYDRDMPEFPWAVDLYGDAAVASWFPIRSKRASAPPEDELEAIRKTVGSEPFVKLHVPKAWGSAQYERLGRAGVTRVVKENGLSFEVNLSDYLDTGLFLDHRDTRQRVREEAKGKHVLNLFAYTGAFTVYAAAGGAESTTSVDLSRAYCDWAKQNLKLNGLHGNVLCADVLQWLETAKGPFDLIVLDPPSFSTSKRMGRSFEVQRDHVWLLERTRALLKPGGTLYFSTNFRGFELDRRVEGATELTPRSLPEDFRPGIHRLFRL
jgi:23S rRNA (cytosine1962-C5)-methyltransferase